MAPGKAPTKTDSEVTDFKGVYTLVYKKMETAPNIADLGFIEYSKTSPVMVNALATNKATLGVIRPEGTGRFLVRSINASKSFSIT